MAEITTYLSIVTLKVISILQSKDRDRGKRQNLTICCLQEMYLTGKDKHRVKGWKSILRKWSPRASRSSYIHI
jgi:hypothetical protein